MNTELLEILDGFKKAWGLIDKKNKISLLLAIIIIAVIGLLTNLPAVILGKFVDQITKNETFEFNLALPFIFLITSIILAREGLTVLRKYLVEDVATKTEKEQTVNVINRLLHSDLTFLNQTQIGALHGKVLRSLQGLVRILKLSFLDFIPTIFIAFFAIVLALIQKPFLASIMILVIPTGLYLIFKQISSQKGIRVSLLRGKEKIDGTVVEMLGGIETVRTADTTDLEVSRIENFTENSRLQEIRHHISMAFFDAAKRLNEGLFYILVVSLAIYFSATGTITKGDILVYSILFMSITSPLREIHRILDQAHESSILVSDLYSLINQPEDISFSRLNKPAEKKLDSSIIVDVKNLEFKYPSSSKDILKGINLQIRQGEKIGIAGASGCGKSTFIKLLLRLIHGFSGQIALFGQNIESVDRHELAQRIAYIPQFTYIFNGSIKDNITYGSFRENVDNKEIIRAARLANIYDEINSSLGGFEGKVAEGGKNLSGGQRQRLALARIILKNPDLLIFDEATSALDNTNEEIIYKNLEKLFKDRTIITIAHRLSTLKNSDRILVFDKGKIVQEGNYQDLSKEKGLFQTFLNQGL